MYDDDMGHDADFDIGFDSGASDDGLVAIDPTTGRSPGTQALLDAVAKSSTGQKVDGWQDHGTPGDWNSPEARFARGDTIINPKATAWDWITGPIEYGIYGASRLATFGKFGLDVELGLHDVTGWKGQTDASHYGAGIKGEQEPFSAQLDVGFPGLSGLGPLAPDIGTISVGPKGVGVHSTFDPEKGAFGTAARDAVKDARDAVKDAIKGASSYYAGGGLASLPQISHSGLYRAMGRG
jgi:hypothetical protein